MRFRWIVIAAIELLLALPQLQGQGFDPNDAVVRMTPAAGFEVELVACEPLVRQPVCIEFDDRGRLWVVQYLQYPNPEGLSRVKVDRYSRTQYDRVPPPPPHGPKGADRITILEDTDGDGRMDSGRDFVSDLNLASGIALGNGGVYVLNVPYLLFYPDKDRDDVPDSDPEVLLRGFGMEDAHSVANSLTFGPDGWLYGCQGSTVTANIRGIEFQQGVWRYHPQTQAFELFCEGGGNSWGLDFDRAGNLLYSTNYGGYVLLHGVQGGYFIKSFAKHGALHNPHAYGYFQHAPHQNFTGGHVTVGGIVYQGDSFPKSFRGKYIAGDLLGHGVHWHAITPDGSTFTTTHGGTLLAANDAWFAPTDLTMGPDGAIYVADWHDARTAHPDPDADWDRSNGRIYRIAARGTKRAAPIDFAKLTTAELLKLHEHPSQWYVRRARQELSRRQASSVGDSLREMALRSTDETIALEALWSLHAVGALNRSAKGLTADPSLAIELLDSPHPPVRSWMLRLLGDEARAISRPLAGRLERLAHQESSPTVRQQIACTAARLPPHQALPVINAGITCDRDSDDPYLPLLWWWAIEKQCVSNREEMIRCFVAPTHWESRLSTETLLPRLVRRYTAEGTADGFDSVGRLLRAAPDNNSPDSLWKSVLQGWREIPQDQQHRASTADHEISKLALERWQENRRDLILMQLNIALGRQEAVQAAFQIALDSQAETDRRVAALNAMTESADASSLPSLVELANSDAPQAVRVAALKSLGRGDDPRLASRLIDLHGASESEIIRSQIRETLLARKETTKAWLEAVDDGRVEAATTPLDQIRRVAFFEDRQLDALVAKHWGKLQGASRGEKLAEVRRLGNDLRAGSGNVDAGKVLFQKHCATCHRFLGEGTEIGPDLTTANRTDRNFLLVSLVDPSSVIRKEYVNVVVQTTDGRVLVGLPAVRDDAGVTLVNAKNERIAIAAGEIESLHESPVSMMPDDLYRRFQPQQLRDLFAYLQSEKR